MCVCMYVRTCVWLCVCVCVCVCMCVGVCKRKDCFQLNFHPL